MPGGAPSFVLRSRRVLLPEGERPACVAVEAGRIAGVLAHDDARASDAEDLGDLVLMPGLVDTHVHLNEPGNTDWEGFASGTAAAAAGGFTTVVDMPLNSLPVTTTPAAVAAKRAAAAGNLSCRVGLWGGVVAGMGEPELEVLLDAGVLGVKAFLCDSGLPAFQAAGETELRAAMRVLVRRGLPLLAHAELVSEENGDNPRFSPDDASGLAAIEEKRGLSPFSHAAWAASRPPRFEREAVDLLIRLCRETGCRTHVVHVADAGCLAPIAAAKAEGLPLTAETCPHYLCFCGEEVPEGATEFKCAPPLRDAANRDALWAGLRDGTLDLVASDHSPCPPSLKAQDTGDFFSAWGGIASLQVSFAATWAEASRRGFGARPRWSDGWARRPPRWPVGPSALQRATPPTSSPSAPTRPGPSAGRTCFTATRSRPTRAARSAAGRSGCGSAAGGPGRGPRGCQWRMRCRWSRAGRPAVDWTG